MTQPMAHGTLEVNTANALVGELAKRVLTSIGAEGKPDEVLKWLADKPKNLVREAIVATQPKGWAVASKPLVDSLSDDQCVGFLAALMAVYVQTL